MQVHINYVYKINITVPGTDNIHNMKVSLASIWENVRTSFWFIPTLMTLGAIALSVFTLWFDERLANMGSPDVWWIYSGGASGARSVLAVVSGSMITVTSVVFSITIVTLTLASGQFGSRLLRNFMRDTGNQVVLGTFIATFIYSLLILRSVRGEGEDEFIPYCSVTVGVFLVFLSVGVLIYFIHHVSTKIQAESIVSAIFEETTEAVDNQFPKQLNDERNGINRQQSLHADLPASFHEETYKIKAGSSNYLQVVEYEKLLKLAEKYDLVIEILYKPGDFIIRDSTIILVWPPHKIDDSLSNKLYNNFILGVHQTLTQNAEYGIQQLVEIAVRALSPGINDPFTAINCIDRLAAILCQIARKQFPSPFHCNEAGKIHIVAKTTTFEGYVDTAFNQIRQNSKSSPAVMIKLMDAIYMIVNHLSLPEQYGIVRKHAEMIKNTGQNNLEEQQDQQDLQSRYERIVKLQEV